MKRFLLLCCLFLIVPVTFAGCAVKSAHEMAEYPWSVILVSKYELKDESVPAGAIDALSSFFSNQIGTSKIVCDVARIDKTLQIVLEFYGDRNVKEQTGYKTFRQFYGLPSGKDDLRVVDFKLDVKAFFYERTQKFENPWKTVLESESAKPDQINKEVEKWFGSALVSNVPEYVYLFESSFRRSSAEGAYKVVNNFSTFDYYYRASGDETVDQIVLFDRFENSPLWYAVAVGGTVLFMLLVYIIFANTRKKRYNDPWQSQSSPTSTGI